MDDVRSKNPRLELIMMSDYLADVEKQEQEAIFRIKIKKVVENLLMICFISIIFIFFFNKYI